LLSIEPKHFARSGIDLRPGRPFSLLTTYLSAQSTMPDVKVKTVPRSIPYLRKQKRLSAVFKIIRT